MTMIFQSSIAKSIKNNVRSVFLIFFVFVPLFTIQDVQARTLYSKQSGAWWQPSTWTRHPSHQYVLGYGVLAEPQSGDTVIVAAGHEVQVTNDIARCDILYIGTDGTSISQPHNNIKSGTVTIAVRWYIIAGTDLWVFDKLTLMNGGALHITGGILHVPNGGIEYIGTNNLIRMYQDDNNIPPQIEAHYLCRAPGQTNDNASISYLNVPGTKDNTGVSRFSAHSPYTNRATFDNPNGITNCECGSVIFTNNTNSTTSSVSINANEPKFYNLVTNSNVNATFNSNDIITIRGYLKLNKGTGGANLFDIGNNTLLFNSELNETISPADVDPKPKFDNTYSIKMANGGRVMYKRTNAFTYGSANKSPLFLFPITVGNEYICGIVNFSNGDLFGANSLVEFSPRIKTLIFDEPVINSEDFYIDFRMENINFATGDNKFASIDICTQHDPNDPPDTLRRLLYEIYDVTEPIQRIGECVHEGYDSKKTGTIFKQSFKIVDLGARPIYKHLALLIMNRFYSVQSGNWKEDINNYANAVWTPLKTHKPLGTSDTYKRFFLEPDSNSRVVIAKNHNITIDSAAKCGYLYVGSDNNVVSIPGATSDDKKGTLNVTNGATLTIGEKFISDTENSKLNIMNNAILNVNNAAQVVVKGNSLFDGIGATINISDLNTGFVNEGIFKYKHDDTPNPTAHLINISNGDVHFYKGLMREQGVINDGAALNFTQSAGTVSIYECDPLGNRSEFDAPNGIFNVTGGEIVFEPVRTGNTGNNILAIDVPNNTTFYKLISRVDNVDASKANMNLIVSDALQLATTVTGNNIFNIASNTLTFNGGNSVNFDKEFIYVSNPTSVSLDDFSVSRSILKTPDGHVRYSYTNGSTPIAFNQDKKFLFPISMEDRFFGSSINLKGNSTQFLSNSNTTIEILPFSQSPTYQVSVESKVNAYWKTDLQGIVALGTPDLEFYLDPNEITSGTIYRIDDPTNAIPYTISSSTNTLNVVNTTLQASATEISDQLVPAWNWIPTGTNSSENYWSILTIYYSSIRSGRWSDPLTWNVGKVPSPTDEVELKHIVYTGLYDNTTNILGSRQWAEAEEDISGADLTVPGVAKLCKKLTILGDGTNNGGLLIGNNAPAPANGAPRRVLSFGEVHNNSLGDENLELNLNINSFKVTGASLYELISRMKGIYIMEDGGTGTNLFKPQMQVLKIESKGSIFNSSILEIGAY